MSQWIDITVAVENGMLHWPGDIRVEVSKIKSMEQDNEVNITNLHLSAHTATHIDAPLHFVNEGKDVSQLPLDIFIGTAKVIQIKDSRQISLHEIKNFPFKEGDRILFKTRNSESEWWKNIFKKILFTWHLMPLNF